MSVSDFMLALPGILFWVGLFVVLRVTRKSRAEAPKNAAQRKLVNDVIAIIERTATLTGPLCIPPAARKDQQAVRMVDILLFSPYAEDDLNTILNLMAIVSAGKWR